MHCFVVEAARRRHHLLVSQMMPARLVAVDWLVLWVEIAVCEWVAAVVAGDKAVDIVVHDEC